MPGQQQDTDGHQAGGCSTAHALSRLKDQRLQRAGQRLQAVGKQGAHPQDAAGPHQQQVVPSSHHAVSQPTRGANKLPCTAPCKRSCSQQHTGSNSHMANRMVTTAVRGMQSRPPSRAENVRASLDVASGQPAVRAQVAPSPIVAAASSAAQHSQPADAGHHVMCPADKHLPAATVSSRCPLAVQGTSLAVQLIVSPTHSKARVGSAGKKAVGIRRQSRLSMDGGVSSCGQLGCGMAWSAFQHLAAAVRMRALHLTKQQQEQQRMQLARAVAGQWLWWVHSKRQEHIADEHYSRQLKLAGLLGLQQEVSHQQLLQRQASLQASKQAFMQLSRCFLVWQQLMQQQQQMKAAVAVFQGRHHKQLLGAAVQEWCVQVARLRGKRQLLLRAQAHWTFRSMLMCLHAWQSWVTDQQMKRLKYNRAVQHWQRAILQHVVTCWRTRVADAAYEWQQLATALCFHKHSLQCTATRAWLLGIERQQGSRTAAEQRLTQWRQKQQQQLAHQVLRTWRNVGEQQRYLQQTQAELVRVLQDCRKHQVLWHWLQLVHYHKQLATAPDALSSVGDVWWGRHCLYRWQRVVEVMGGQRSAELRQLVQMRACIGTWLRYTEQQRMSADKLSAAKAALQHNQLSRILPAWQDVAAALHNKQQQQQLADEHFAAHQLERLFVVWRQNVVALVEERQHEAAADELHSSVLLQHAWQAWHWYWWHSSMKRFVPEVYLSNLQRRALAGWKHFTAAKLEKEAQRRQAVRNCYLKTLSKGLTAWQQAMTMGDRKQQLLQSADAQYCQHLQARALEAWHGPFREHQQHKRTQLAQATSHHQQQLKRHAMVTWQAAVGVAKAEHAQQLHAEQHRHKQLQHKSLAAWHVVVQQEQAKRQQLAAAAEPAVQALQVLKQRRVLRAWRQVQAQQQRLRHQILRAQQHHHQLVLLKSLTSWQQYLQQQQVKSAANRRASQYRRRTVAAGVLVRLRQHVSAAGVKRQRLFVAALHRRSWLTTRAWRAWRLTTAMSRLVQAVQSPQKHKLDADIGTQCRASCAITLQQQQPVHPGLDAIAAAVVAASCSSMERWQQQCKQQLRHSSSRSDQQQEQHRLHPGRGQDLTHQEQHGTATVSTVGTEQQLLVQALLSTSGADVSRATSRAVARRAPRLPAFLQEQQQQAGTAPDVPGRLQSSSLPEQQQREQHESCVLLPAERERQCLLNTCSPWRGSPPGLLALQQQHSPATCIRGAVAAVPAASSAAAWYTPQVSKTKRPPPRQLRTAAGIVASSRTQLTPALQQQGLQPPAAGAVLVSTELQQQPQQSQHDEPQHAGSLPIQQEQCQQSTALSQRPEQLRRQQDWQHQQLAHELGGQQRVSLQQQQHFLQGPMRPEQQHPQQQQPGMLQQQQLLHWQAPAPLQEAHPWALHTNPQPSQHSKDVQVLLVQHGTGQHHHMVDQDPASLKPAAGLQPSSAQVMARYPSQQSVDCTGTVISQQQGHISGLLPSTPCTFSSSSTSAAQQLTFQDTQPLQYASTPATAAPALVAPGPLAPQQVLYTPLTRQMLQEEVSALERTLQQCKMLKAAVDSRQQQASSLQQQVALLTQQPQLPSQQPQRPGIDSGVEQDQQQQQQQEEMQQELIDAQHQLSYVQSELSELQYEQARQQPRLAAIAERIQQLKGAATRARPSQP